MEIIVNRFLGKNDVVTKYENWLKTVCDKNKVTRAEVEAFYRDNIRALIASVVDEEFNKISFLLNNATTNSIRGHNSVLTRNSQTGQYILSYGGAYTNDEQRTITANSLEALSSEMRNGKYKADFDETGINAVKAQALLIPAVVYEKNKNTAMTSLKNIVTDFYLNPTSDNYEKLIRSYKIYRATHGDETLEAMYQSLVNTLTALSPALAERVAKDARE